MKNPKGWNYLAIPSGLMPNGTFLFLKSCHPFGIYKYYFAGIFFSVSTRKSQNLMTDSMFTFSSGE